MILGRLAELARNSWLGRITQPEGNLSMTTAHASRTRMAASRAARIIIDPQHSQDLTLQAQGTQRLALTARQQRPLTMETTRDD